MTTNNKSTNKHRKRFRCNRHPFKGRKH